MTDFSKIKTMDELEFQTNRMQRRATIQREKVEGHVEFVARQYHQIVGAIDAVVAPVRKTINEYRTTIRVVSRIAKAFLPKKK